MPSSVQRSTTSSSSRDRDTVIERPSGVYLTALLTRLAQTRSSSSGSPRATTGSPGVSTLMSSDLRRAATDDRSSTSSTTRPRSTGTGMIGVFGSPTFESSSRSSITRPSRVAPRSMALSDRLHLVAQPGHALEDLEVADDRGERVLQLVGDGRDQLALVGVERLQLLDQLVLALEGAGVEDRAAQVVADVGSRRRLDLGPVGLARRRG